jgi:hypothetical protein
MGVGDQTADDIDHRVGHVAMWAVFDQRNILQPGN